MRKHPGAHRRAAFLSKSNSVSRLAALLVACVTFASAPAIFADETSARAQMQDANNPLIALFSSRGPLYIELLPGSAPRNVARTLDLIEGRYAFSGTSMQTRYYDQSSFKPVTAMSLRFGNPADHRYGLMPQTLSEEIDAGDLGLNEEPLLSDQGDVAPRLGIASRAQFEREILAPLYATMGIHDAAAVEGNSSRVFEKLQEMNVADALSNLGHRFSNGLDTPMMTRGTVALVSDPAGSATPEIFIALVDSPWLDGRMTPIGRIVEGLDTADSIGANPISTEDNPSDAVAIYSLRAL